MDIPKEFLPVLLVQIALFLGLWMALKRLWFDPALKVIGAREARSHGAVAEARVLQAEGERLRREHESAIHQARAEAQRDVQELLRQAEAEQRRTIAQATEDAQRTAAEVRGRVALEVEAARLDLRAQVPEIAREVAKVVLGRAR